MTMDEVKVFRPVRSKYLVITADYILPIIICISVIGLFYFTLYSSFFKINTIVCVLDFRNCDDLSIIAEIDKLKGQNIFTLSPQKITARLTSGDFTIREAKLTRQLPGIVTINLQSVYPVVAIRQENDPKWVTLDGKMRVIGARIMDPNVPSVIVTFPLTLTVGKPPSSEIVVRTLGIARRLADELFSFKTIKLIDEDTIQIALLDGRTAIFTPKKDELIQLHTLQLVLLDDKIIKGARYIDVRFSQPVLR